MPDAGRAAAPHCELADLFREARCFAIVRYDTASGRVRDVVGLFRDPTDAAGYVDEYRVPRCEVVPATAVVPRMP
jgi:hypothetical protein